MDTVLQLMLAAGVVIKRLSFQQQLVHLESRDGSCHCETEVFVSLFGKPKDSKLESFCELHDSLTVNNSLLASCVYGCWTMLLQKTFQPTMLHGAPWPRLSEVRMGHRCSRHARAAAPLSAPSFDHRAFIAIRVKGICSTWNSLVQKNGVKKRCKTGFGNSEHDLEFLARI